MISFVWIYVLLRVMLLEGTHRCLGLWLSAPAVAAAESEQQLLSTHTSSVLQSETRFKRSCCAPEEKKRVFSNGFAGKIVLKSRLIQDNDEPNSQQR